MTDDNKELKEKVEEIADSKQKTEESPLSETEENLQKLKEANDLTEKELQRQEELRSKVLLGGKAKAGEPEPSEQEKADEAAKKLLEVYQ